MEIPLFVVKPKKEVVIRKEKNILKKCKDFFKYFRFNFFKKMGKIKLLFLVYFVIVLLGTVLLYSPYSQINYETNQISFIDALFTASSAFSDTGLTTRPTALTWTSFGQTVIAILILIGGIGFFALKFYFFNWLFKRTAKIYTKKFISVERGSNDSSTITANIIVSVNFIFIMILLSSFILTIFFYFSPSNFVDAEKHLNPQYNFLESIKFGIFHSISSINNAGFDIIGSHSITPYYNSIFLQLWLLILFLIGGIGYPVIFDLWHFSLAKFSKQRYHFSLFTKISLMMYFVVGIVGLLCIIAFETTSVDPTTFWNLQSGDVNLWNYSYGNGFDKIMALTFTTAATRSAGFYNLDVNDLTSPSLAIMSLLMFIGSSPSSTGGGIRTTTFLIIILGLWSKMSSKPTVRIFKRKISDETVFNSFIAFILSCILLLLGTLFLYSSFKTFTNFDNATLSEYGKTTGERGYSFIHVVFEVASAFGTTGISTGISSNLNITSKITLILIMFIGQLGISSTILLYSNNNSRFIYYDYPEEDVLIG